MADKIPYELRCKGVFERRGKGKRYVYARWGCPRKALKGLNYCSYCEPRDEARTARLEAKRVAKLLRDAAGGNR